MTNRITLALPSKGAIAEPANNFLMNCGFKVSKPNPRQYTGYLKPLRQVDVLFQRVKDIVYKVADGTAQLGITGYDVVYENQDDNLLVIHDDLGFGHCRLVIAVPEAWIDVDTIIDLAEVALDFRERMGRNLRVATTFPNSTRWFFHEHGIHHFTIVKAEGAIEAAPTIGYADVIVDLMQTGTTLRENHLKEITNGTIIESQACLVANRQALIESPSLLPIVRTLLEMFDSTLHGQKYQQITVNISGDSQDAVATKIIANPATRGLLGPTISPIVGAQSDRSIQWHTVTVTAEKENLLVAVDYLRSIGATQVIVSPVRHVFMEISPHYAKLLEELGIKE